MFRRAGFYSKMCSAMDTVQLAYDALRLRITDVFPDQIRTAVNALTDEQIWWRPNESSNSIGNIVLHLSGSLDHYLSHNLGGLDFTRDRPAEFNERRMIPKEELLARFDQMVANARRTFEHFAIERLGEPSPEPRMATIVFEDIVNIAVHVANHAGQILWIAKMLEASAIDEVWMRTHKAYVWKPKA